MRAGASEALEALSRKASIIYFVTTPGLEYRRVRTWLETRFTEKRCPPGPVLGWPAFAEATSAAAVRRGVAGLVQNELKMQASAIVGKAEAAGHYGRMPVRVLGAADTGTWADVANEFAK